MAHFPPEKFALPPSPNAHQIKECLEKGLISNCEISSSYLREDIFLIRSGS